MQSLRKGRLALCCTLAMVLLANISHAQHEGHVHQNSASATASWDFFTNFGSYMRRTHCIVNAEGEADWPWIITLITLTLGVIFAYLRIYYFWMKTHHEQESQDRNKKMFELANIFFWCAICGYAFSVLAFAWPAYRLLAAALLLLNIWSWKFVLTDLGEFKQSLCSKAMERGFREQLEERNRSLEHDVRERTKELEIARKRAEEANMAKSQFLATMSHEIRTPMTAILGYAEMLAEESADHFCQKQSREAAETIHINSQHLLMLIDDILDVSKIEAGRMTVERIPVSPFEIVESVRALQQTRAESSGIELVVAYQTALPERIQSDPTRLRQILHNLVSNALKFTREGRITIAVSYDQASSQIRFEIQDTGMGMTPKHLDRIRKFEAFQQADSTTTRRFGGSGLGLKISSELATLLGGSITIDSVFGKGTTVTLNLAVESVDKCNCLDPSEIYTSTQTGTPDANSEPGATHRGQHVLRNISILLAEDGQDNQKLITYLLKSQGASVTVAGNGQEAIELVEKCGQEAFDIVLMDMQMPVLDGYEATKRLRKSGFTRPILALTAHAMNGSREHCLQAGCDDYLQKPIDRQAIFSAIPKWVAMNNQHRAA